MYIIYFFKSGKVFETEKSVRTLINACSKNTFKQSLKTLLLRTAQFLFHSHTPCWHFVLFPIKLNVERLCGSTDGRRVNETSVLVVALGA